MTIEQLLCPAVMSWERNFRKQLNESHIEMTDEQIADEFDKWLIENEDLVNQSVDDNLEHINETIQRNMEKVQSLNESIFDDDAFAEDADDDVLGKEIPEEPEAVTGKVEGEEVDPNEPEETRSSLTGAIKLTDNKKSKYNIFGFINDFYDLVEEEKSFDDDHYVIMRKLDVSDVTNMAALFAFTNLPNLNLSSWDTGRVKAMEGMFYKSTFNNDSICGWDVSSCADFKNMFLFSAFNQSLSKWTPKWVEKNIRNEDGTMEKKTVRADLPIIGGTEDEARAIAKTYRRGLFKTMREEEKSANESKLAHVIDFDTFVNEGKVRDFLRKGVEKVKSFFSTIAVKLNKFVPVFNENGEVYDATSAYTSLNLAASGEIPGVTAFCDVDNDYLDGVQGTASVVESPEYYGIIKKDSVEYKNYLTFSNMLNEHYEKFGNTGPFQMINEDGYKRVGFSAEEGGVDALDIDSDDLREILEDVIENVPANKGDNHGGAVFIWGAPGIGKSSIPKSIVKKWNEKKGDKFHKKALMVVQCGDLTIDGFSLPIPVRKSIQEYLEERPNLYEIIKNTGVPTDKLEKIKQNLNTVSTEAPKTWLPAFKMTPDQDEVNVLNDIANGHLEIKNKDGKVVANETTEGGILLFDEFFRANEEIFKILMQLILNREYSGYMLGNKWGILCCSNRPNDDEEVRTGFEKTGAVVGTRMLAGAYNFIPSFAEWKKWAVKEGGFDAVTLDFLMKDKNPKGEYTNWHTIRPDEYTARGKTAWPTPRTWSALINELNLYKDNHGYADIVSIPEKKIIRIATGIIGAEMAARYANHLKTYSKNIQVDAKRVLEDPSYEIPSTSSCPVVTDQILSYVTLKYDADELPDVKLMMNMYNKLAETYPSGAKDNLVKMMHVNIIKAFKVMTIKANRMALKEYLQAAGERYNIVEADMR